MKRLSFVFVCLILCCGLVFSCISVSASENDDDVTIYKLGDYVYNYLFNDDGTGYAQFSFPDYLYRIQTIDKNGTTYLPEGTFSGTLFSNSGDGATFSLGLYTPGAMINDSYFDISALHNGAVVSCEFDSGFEFVSSPQDYVIVRPCFRIAYYDNSFSMTGYQRVYSSDIIVDSSGYSGGFKADITINIPDNSQYFVLYLTFEATVDRSYSDSSYLRFILDTPNFEIQTNYYNTIINGLVKPRPPENSGTVDDAGDIEDILNDTTSDGRDEADRIFQSAWDAIADYAGGFVFVALVVESLCASRWIYSILIVSLALGIFGMIVNLGNSISTSFERKSNRGGSK